MRPILFIPLCVSWLLLPSCKKKEVAAPVEMPPAHVTFSPARQETVSVTRELPGRFDAVRVAEVRARVAGILLKREFEEGADVKAGDVLFRIDPLPLEAALQSAKANLARANASVDQAENLAKRYRELVSARAVSRQQADDAESALTVAKADALAAQAQLDTATLNLGYATVTAPISGRTGTAVVTEGALVGQNEATLLTTIQQLDPIYFDFTQSGADMIAMKKAMAGKNDAKVTLLLEDGSEYQHAGKVLFAGTTVDETTGMVKLRAEFPNPDQELLPGMFARAKVIQAVHKNAITVPQRAVTRGMGGAGSVLVIDENDVVQPRTVQTSEIAGDNWVITSGLKPGERVVMEGHLKAKPGAKVIPEPFGEKPQASAAPAAK
ncbi:MAG: efflux RND transporter periplasmic adaptor subunit [Verrucomicrobiota bacterium]